MHLNFCRAQLQDLWVICLLQWMLFQEGPESFEGLEPFIHVLGLILVSINFEVSLVPVFPVVSKRELLLALLFIV